MKFKFYTAVALMLAATQAFAQCGQRYKDMIFSNVDVTSDVVYSTSNSTTLKLDVYQPQGDNEAQRPLIVLAHGGSFIGGTKTDDNVVVQLANNFAKRGYVVASIDYRLGNAIQMATDSSYAIDVVLKAISDGKSAVRFFRKDAATTNTYRINPNFILAGGNSAGSVLYAHAMYIDSLGEVPANLQTTLNNNGGLEGNSGNDGYSSQIQGLFDLAGGLNVPEFIGPGQGPSVNFQGDQDATVPYMCNYAVSQAVHVRLCGLGAMEPLLTNYGINHVSVVFPGDQHCPWQNDANKFTKVDTTSANFFYNIICTTGVGINEVEGDAGLSIYPSPAQSQLTVNMLNYALYKEVQLVDETGKLLAAKNVEGQVMSFERGQLAAGIYFVRLVKNNGSTVTRKAIFE
ncbi:MAG: T9SS type A sorting domain-containing protein [Chitinophagales bacterium]